FPSVQSRGLVESGNEQMERERTKQLKKSLFKRRHCDGRVNSSFATALFALSLLIPGASVHAVLLSYEGFDYSVGSSVIGQNGGFGFSQAWQTNGSQGVYTNQGFSLKYTDTQSNRLVTIGGSLLIQG